MVEKLFVAALVALSSLGGTHIAHAEVRESSAEQGPPTDEQDTRININEADANALIALPGIGPARAEAIIAEREKRRFRRVEDIMRVPGIGRKTFVRIRGSIRVR